MYDLVFFFFFFSFNIIDDNIPIINDEVYK